MMPCRDVVLDTIAIPKSKTNLQVLVPNNCVLVRLNFKKFTVSLFVRGHKSKFLNRDEGLTIVYAKGDSTNSLRVSQVVHGEEFQRSLIKDPPIKVDSTFNMVIQVLAKAFEVRVNGKSMGKYKHAIPIEALTDIEVSGDIQVDNINFILKPITQDFREAMDKFTPIIASLREEIRVLRDSQIENAATIRELAINLKDLEKRFDEKVKAFDPAEAERIHSAIQGMHEKFDSINQTEKHHPLIDDEDSVEIDAEDEKTIVTESGLKTECPKDGTLVKAESSINNSLTVVSLTLLLILTFVVPVNPPPELRPMQ